MAESVSVWRPARWLAHLPLAVLPFLAAAAIDGRGLAPELTRRVSAALAGAGEGWAAPVVSGRDVEIRGVAPSAAAAARAAQAAAATFGVRRVDLHVAVAAN